MNQQDLIKFIQHIPNSNQPARTIVDLHEMLNLDTSPDSLRATAIMLRMLGLVDYDGDSVRASGHVARYALTSISHYITESISWVDDWEQRGDIDQPPFNHGAALLAALDQRRLMLNPSAPPSRVEKVAQALISRMNPITHQPELLLQYDVTARRYQLIGGRYSPTRDATLADTLARELTEELPANVWQQNMTYSAIYIADISIPPAISPTFGALTQYHFSIYHLTNLQELIIGDDDRWFSVGTLLNPDNSTLSADFFMRLDALLTEGLAGLSSSFNKLS